MNDIFSLKQETFFGKDAQRLLTKIRLANFKTFTEYSEDSQKGKFILNDILVNYPLGNNYHDMSEFLFDKGVDYFSNDDHNMIMSVQLVYSLVNWYIVCADNRLHEDDHKISFNTNDLRNKIIDPLDNLLNLHGYIVIKNSDDPNLSDAPEHEWAKCFIYQKDNIDVILTQNIKSNNPDIIKLKTVILDFLKIENQTTSNNAYALMAHIYRNYESEARCLLDGRTITMKDSDTNQKSINLFKTIMGTTPDHLGGQSLRHRIENQIGKKTLSDNDANTLGLFIAKCFLIAYAFDEIFELQEKVKKINI